MERTGVILRAIFDSTDDVWFLVAPDYSVILYNQKALENGMLLHGREIQVGDSILDYARDTRNNIDARFLESFAQACKGQIIKNEQHIEYESASIWLRSKYTPVYEQDNLLGVSILIEDISRQKIMEEDQARYQEEILKLSNKREEFINIASHELKTPLTSLKASLQLIYRMLERGASFQSIKTFLDKSNLSINKLNALIRDLLDTNKIGLGALNLDQSVFNLAALVESCCDHVRMEGKHHIRVAGDLQLEVYADKGKIDQVLVNLVNNAVKYAANSTYIVVHIEKQQNMAKVAVQDFGPGIAPEKLAHLFTRYYQGDLAGSHSSGMGLGLYIADGIIKRHGGQIGVETEAGKGSTFWFTLPLQPA